MKKLVALVLAAMMLLACMPVLAEVPEGYPEVVPGIDFGGAEVFIYDFWTADDTRKEEPNEEEEAPIIRRAASSPLTDLNLLSKPEPDLPDVLKSSRPELLKSSRLELLKSSRPELLKSSRPEVR